MLQTRAQASKRGWESQPKKACATSRDSVEPCCPGFDAEPIHVLDATCVIVVIRYRLRM